MHSNTMNSFIYLHSNLRDRPLPTSFYLPVYFFLSHPRGNDSFTFSCYNFLDNFLLIILSWVNLTTTTKKPTKQTKTTKPVHFC